MKPSLTVAAALGFVGFVTSFGAHVVAVNLPTYAEGVGASLAMIGLLIAVYDMAEIVAKPLFGALADRAGMKRTMLAGIALFVVASLFYPFVSPELLVGVRFLQGVGAAALSAVSLALVGVYFSENRGRAYGIYNAIKGAGYVVSPFVGGAIVLHANFAAIFYATALIGVLAFLVACTLPKPDTAEKPTLDDDDDFSLRSLWHVARQPELSTWYFVIVVNMFFVGILFGFLPVYIATLGYTSLESGIVISVVALAYLLVQPIAGWAADMFDTARTIKAGLLLSGLSVIAAPFTRDTSLLALSIVAGVGVGVVWTNSDLLVSRLAKGRLGATMGVAGSFKEFGDMLGPLLIGVLSQWFGLTAGFLICGALGLLSLLLVAKRQAPSRAAEPGSKQSGKHGA